MNRHCYFFHLQHSYVTETDASGDEVREHKEIGIYSTLRRAREALERFRPLPGFCSHPDDFVLQRTRCRLSGSRSKSDVTVAYMPYHERYLPESDCDYVTRGDLFDSPEEAQAQLMQWRSEPGFIWCEEGAGIAEYIIDQDSRFWGEGFSRGDD